jgi:hypothetical protein
MHVTTTAHSHFIPERIKLKRVSKEEIISFASGFNVFEAAAMSRDKVETPQMTSARIIQALKCCQRKIRWNEGESLEMNDQTRNALMQMYAGMEH